MTRRTCTGLLGAAFAGSAPRNEPWRPQYHFTPRKNWMNDPNGLIYFDGEYHLFFQYNPFGDKWGHMSWGHAVSPDLLRWRELPVALAEEDGVMIFSGSIVADGSRMVAIYTGHTLSRQHQNLAFSEDRGRTWRKFEGNPVLDIGQKDFRDPKVIRWRDRWIMTVALPKQRQVRFYESRDLEKWIPLSDFGPAGAVEGIWECPDLFELDGKWVLIVNLNPGGVAGGSGGQYFIGEFDGKSFRVEHEDIRWIDYGSDLYATVSYFGTPGRTIWQGWMSNWRYAAMEPTSPWRTAQSLPREIRLRNGRILQAPVREIASLRGATLRNPSKFQGDSYELTATLDPGGVIHLRTGLNGERTSLAYSPGELSLDRRHSGQTGFHPEFAAVHRAPVEMRGSLPVRVYVDRSSVEVFAGAGEIVLTDRIFPGPASLGLSAEGNVRDLELRPLRSVWR